MQANLKFARPFAVALGLFALSGTAYAADVVSEEPPAPAPIAELPVASWAGPYAGINRGFEGSLRARLGYAVTPEILLYGTAGGALKDQKIEAGGFSNSQTPIGWTAGVGTDIKITDNVFGRVEYRYTDFGSKDYDNIGSVKSFDNRVTFGVGMKF